MCGVGRRLSISGPARARMMGTVATIVPTVAGSAYRVDSMTKMLNAASPTAARSTIRVISRAFSLRCGSRRARMTRKSGSAPAAYRRACPP